MTRRVDSGENTLHTTPGNECKIFMGQQSEEKKRH